MDFLGFQELLQGTLVEGLERRRETQRQHPRQHALLSPGADRAAPTRNRPGGQLSARLGRSRARLCGFPPAVSNVVVHSIRE